MTGTVIPQSIYDHLFAQIPAGRPWKSTWGHYLRELERGSLLTSFTAALDEEDIDVHADQVEDEIGEICVRATGRAKSGSYWSNLNIILLAPWWNDQAEASQGLADAIVDQWHELRILWRASQAVPA